MMMLLESRCLAALLRHATNMHGGGDNSASSLTGVLLALGNGCCKLRVAALEEGEQMTSLGRTPY